MKKITFALIAVAITLAACSKKTAPSSANKDVPVNALSVFSTNCARCHGETGTEGKAPNLSKTTLEKDKLIETITNGRDHMPTFKDKLSEKEIAAVADWIVSIRK